MLMITIPVKEMQLTPGPDKFKVAKETVVSFDYTDQKNRKYSYEVQQLKDDRESFLRFYHNMVDCFRKKILPWNYRDIPKLKKKVIIKPLTGQMELFSKNIKSIVTFINDNFNL